jgi:endonuclease/exonuclease/phosphatase family metal-dependent hydrolase
MRIATFNVENLDEPIGPRIAVLRPALERLEADILCLQEVNSQKRPKSSERELAALETLIAGTPYADYARASTLSERHGGATSAHNLVTLSRFPIISTRQVRHEKVPPAALRLVTAEPPSDAAEEIAFDRPFLVSEIDIGDETLHVINAHFRAPLASPVAGQKLGPFEWKTVGGWAEGYYLSSLKRTGQALELRLVVDDILAEDDDAKIVVAGDLNAEEYESAMRIIIGAPENTGNTNLTHRSLVLLDRAISPGRRFSVIHYGRPQMLDHMLASYALYGRFRMIAIHNETLGDEAIGYAKGMEAAGSYHAPLVATFALGDDEEE